MPRELRSGEKERKSKARRAFALNRLDLREPSVPRASAVGACSHAVKVMDEDSAAAIAAFIERGAKA
jgi:hypothetical protein